MKKILFYPQKTLNEYTSIMRDCIDKEKYILCKNNSLFDFLFADIIHLNWYENLSPNSLKLYLGFIIKLFYLYFLFVTKKRVVYTLHNKLPHDKSNLALSKYLMDFVLRISDVIILHSKYSVNFVPEKYRLKTAYIPHPSYEGIYENIIESPLHRKENSKLVVLTFGAIKPYKNIESIIKIANDISDLNIEFWICGICNSDDYKIELKNKVRTDNVIFDFRFINNGEIPSLLSKVDIVLIPYNVESSLNSGVAILAFSYAKTVISTEIGTVLDFLDSGMVYVYNNSQNDELKNTLCSIYDLFNLGSTLYPKNPVPPVNNSFSIYLDSNRFLIKSWYCSRTTFFAKNSFATANAFAPIS